MRNIKTSALRVNQINDKDDVRAIYIASLKVRDLINEGQFKIDYWSPSKKETKEQGYQRHPFTAHYKKIAKYASAEDSIFPGAVLISCRSEKDAKSTVVFHDNGDNSGILELQHPPFWIIDGQHRIKGLQHGIEEEGDKRWLDRELPVIILANFSKLEEIAQFKILNTTSKKVSTDLAQQLMLLRASNDKEYRTSLKLGGEDWKFRCLKLIEKLNEADDSPWNGRVKGPNPTKTARMIVGQNSLLVSLKPLYTSGYFENTNDIDHQYEIMRNYWSALSKLFPQSFRTPDESVILKTPGIFSLHSLLRAILQRRGGSQENISQESFFIILSKIFKNYDDYFWSSENTQGASLYGSMKGFRILADDFISELDSALKN